MTNSEVRALRNLLQIITSWNELGRPDRVAQAVRDLLEYCLLHEMRTA